MYFQSILMGCPLGLVANSIKPTFKSHHEKKEKRKSLQSQPILSMLAMWDFI
jgi:hypothetical protein